MNPYVGSFCAWLIATGSIFSFVLYALRKNRRIHRKAVPILNLVTCIVLLYLAIDITKSVPFLSEPFSLLISSPVEPFKTLFEEMKVSHVVLLIVLLVGVSLALRSERKPGIKEGMSGPLGIAWKNFAMMTLLPIIIQYWVLVAATDRLVTPGGVIAVGLFILAGPASWQFAMEVVLFSEKKRLVRSSKIFVIMLVSLAAVLLATLLGLILRANLETIESNVLETRVLEYVASFTMVSIPYFFFYSYWGEAWIENRPIAAIGGMIVLAVFSTIQLANQIMLFIVCLTLWAFLLSIPYIFFSCISTRTSCSCPECKKSGMPTELRIFEGAKTCVNHPEAHIKVEDLKVEKRKSIVRILYMLLFERLRSRPWGDEMKIQIAPDKEEYSPEEEVTVNISIVNNESRPGRLGSKYLVNSRMEAYWRVNRRKHVIGFSPSKLIEPGRQADWSYVTKIPAKPPAYLTREHNLFLEVKATFYEIRPPGFFFQPVTLPIPRVIRVKKILR